MVVFDYANRMQSKVICLGFVHMHAQKKIIRLDTKPEAGLKTKWEKINDEKLSSS